MSLRPLFCLFLSLFYTDFTVPYCQFSILMLSVQANNESGAFVMMPGPLGQSVTCLTVNPGVLSSIPSWSHTFAEIYREIISTAIHLPSTDSRGVVVSLKRKYVQEVLVNCLVKLSQEKKVWLGELTVPT